MWIFVFTAKAGTAYEVAWSKRSQTADRGNKISANAGVADCGH